MRATTSTAQAEPEHPPLACDLSGNPIPFPTRTSAWRVCRSTDGRPRAVKGPDQEPLRLPLSTTREELADMCGPDSYRVYALDDVGEVIGHVSTVNVGLEPRNAMSVEGPTSSVSKSLFAVTSDLRYALETITHMARTNAEAMRSLAESQADLVKAVALTKGPRNVVMPPPPPPPSDDDDDDDDEDEDDEMKTNLRHTRRRRARSNRSPR